MVRHTCVVCYYVGSYIYTVEVRIVPVFVATVYFLQVGNWSTLMRCRAFPLRMIQLAGACVYSVGARIVSFWYGAETVCVPN